VTSLRNFARGQVLAVTMRTPRHFGVTFHCSERCACDRVSTSIEVLV
jgi:hypothetical protein